MDRCRTSRGSPRPRTEACSRRILARTIFWQTWWPRSPSNCVGLGRLVGLAVGRLGGTLGRGACGLAVGGRRTKAMMQSKLKWLVAGVGIGVVVGLGANVVGPVVAGPAAASASELAPDVTRHAVRSGQTNRRSSTCSTAYRAPSSTSRRWTSTPTSSRGPSGNSAKVPEPVFCGTTPVTSSPTITSGGEHVG